MDKTEHPTYLNEYQAERLANLVESKGLMTAPANLKSAILKRSRQMDVQMIAEANHLGRQAELFFYGLKVGAAVVCSIGLILAAPLITRNFAGFNLSGLALSGSDHSSSALFASDFSESDLSGSDFADGQGEAQRIPLHDRLHRSLMEFSERAGAFISEPIDMEVFFND